MDRLVGLKPADYAGLRPQRQYQKIIPAPAFAIYNIAKSSSNIYLPHRLTPDTKAKYRIKLYSHL